MPTRSDEPSPRQRAILEYVRRYFAEHGCSPTVRGIAEALGIPTTAGVITHIYELERLGLMTRRRNKSRALALTARAS